MVKINSGQNDKWSSWLVVKIISGQNEKSSKLKVIKIKCGQMKSGDLCSKWIPSVLN